ncbi:MAG: hypothetical protein ACK52I_04260 [Pseudomonadota bacterium]|jgi:hypothetical protein
MDPRRAIGISLAALAAASCGGGSGGLPPTPSPAPVRASFDFSMGNGGWLSGHADYTPATAPTDVVSEIRTLPAPFSGSGYYSAGTNLSDDLFVYVKTKVSGLTAGVLYRVTAQVQFLTSAPAGCAGVGGPPGESVWVVVGASPAEPLTVFDGTYFRINVERGNQSTSGRDGIVVGTVANTSTDCLVRRWESKTLATPNPSPLTVSADARGEAWFLVGFDSGFESFSAVYYRSLIVEFTPVP